MKVSLINYTQNALELLLFTKGTRLKMSPMGIEEVSAWSDEKKKQELAYMLNTIRSSWEFADFVFMIEGVSRAFTHQLVRHRVGTSFAQQSQRTVDMSEFEYITPDAVSTDKNMEHIYSYHMRGINAGYTDMLNSGAKAEDARGLLPTNISTNIVFKANLRTLSQMCGERLCVKAQGEFQDVMMAIREAVMEVYPWAEPMLRVHCAQTGVCCFPSVTNCMIKDKTFNPATGVRYDEMLLELRDGIEVHALPLNKEEIQIIWESFGGKVQK